MKYMDIGCKVNCWECTQNCYLKSIMELSLILPDFEDVFNYEVLESLKPQAGLLIAQGINIIDVNEDLKILAVSFFVARLKMSENFKK